MNILLVSGIYFPDIGGPATYIPRLANSLVRKGFEVSVVSLTDDLTFRRPDEEWRRIFIPRKINRIKRTLVVAKKIRQEARNSEFIFANGLFLETAIALVGLKPKSTAKIVGDPVWERMNNLKRTKKSIDEFSQSSGSLQSWIYRKIMNMALNSFDDITVPSRGLANIVSNWKLKKPIRVINNGVQCLEPIDSAKRYDVISLARLVSWKQIDKLIEACAIAELSLVIAGDGPEKENLQNLAKKRNCNAIFLGQIDRESAKSLINQSNIFALISTYEGMSFSLLEAMMLGKRILVSDAPGNLEAINDGLEGKVLKDYSVNSIASALVGLNANTSEIADLTINARRRAKKDFCEEKQIEKMCKLIMKEYA
jgi:glycosyltransferase involved in cell wall biosynthesis